MAKTNEQFDQHFKEKLDGHREKPSTLAWERLDSQLSKSSKPALGIWWAVAASVTALLVAGYSFWPSEKGASEEILLAEKTEISIEKQLENQLEKLPEDQAVSTEIADYKVKTESVTTEIKPEKKSNTNQKPKPSPAPVLSETPQNLIAQTEKKSIDPPIVVPLPELKTEEPIVAMPELKTPELEKTIAHNTKTAEDEPLYRVNIYSDGVKKGEAPEKNLITELGKTVGHVEGFLGKVDNGLIELQDKKENLFTSLVSKKNQGDERR